MNTRILSGAAGVLGGLALLIRWLADINGSGLYWVGVVLGVACFFLLGLTVIKNSSIILDAVIAVAIAGFGFALLLMPLGSGGADDPGGSAIKGAVLLVLGALMVRLGRNRDQEIGSHAHTA